MAWKKRKAIACGPLGCPTACKPCQRFKCAGENCRTALEAIAKPPLEEKLGKSVERGGRGKPPRIS